MSRAETMFSERVVLGAQDQYSAGLPSASAVSQKYIIREIHHPHRRVCGSRSSDCRALIGEKTTRYRREPGQPRSEYSSGWRVARESFGHCSSSPRGRLTRIHSLDRTPQVYLFSKKCLLLFTN